MSWRYTIVRHFDYPDPGRTSVYLCAASLQNLAAPQDFCFPLIKRPSGKILATLYSIVWGWRVSRARPTLFYWPKLLNPYYSLLLFFPFLFFLSTVWYCLDSRSALHCRPFLIIIIIKEIETDFSWHLTIVHEK